MFTGIIEELGRIIAIETTPPGMRLLIEAKQIAKNLHAGDSVSVNGCCLTATTTSPTKWTCDVVEETLRRTNLSELKTGDLVNLERAVSLGCHLGGHIVQGHVDGMGIIQERLMLSDESWWVTVEVEENLLRYAILKGSIAVEGVSLTIAELTRTTFSFAMIPHTASITNIGFKRVGDRVNLETDFIAKYIERLTRPYTQGSMA